MNRLLVIDDEPNIRFSIQQVFADDDVEVLGAASAEEGLRLALETSPNVTLLDIRLRECSGLDLFRELRERQPKGVIIFMTGYSSADTAIEAMKLGAYDYLVKPLDAEQLRQVVGQAMTVSRLVQVPALVDESDRPEDKPDRIIGSGPVMRAVCKQIGRIAGQDLSVLILGEGGTGKELVARAIYQHSGRSQAPFLAVSCAAAPEMLLESELFGYERGAFTGADRRRIGKFEQCDGGTLFLDEVGDLAAGTQAKILRLLQDGCFERLGSNETLRVNVRILAATHQDLEALIGQGRFRKDLYYRLRGATIHLPPLGERREDIAELSHYFLFRYNRELGTSLQSIDPETLDLLERYPWPGNVRELQNVIREAIIASSGPTLLPEFLPAEVQRVPAEEPVAESESAPPSEDDWQMIAQFIDQAIASGDQDIYRRTLSRFDRLLIARVMQHVKGNQGRAAEMLGLSRVTLRAKMRAMRLAVERVLAPRDDEADA